uniref:Probable antirepressor protein (Ant) n=1 Tax=Leptospirillum ferrodiazotrophum TaxID=412449 RepID=C6HTU4_9BACT|nr:MAG: probable antirepressor protein (Ant) [Leptospirillum ferrodiazotrophum]
MNTSLLPVPFHGTTLFLVEQNNEPYTPMKPIVEGMGLAWQVQHRKLDSNKERWGITIMVIPSKSGDQETLCMPLRKLPGWLMTIHPTRVKPEIRGKIIQYQNECDDVLWKYWTEGHIPGPRSETLQLKPQEEPSFRIDSVTIHSLPAFPKEDRTFSRKYGEAVLSALRVWSREACAEPVGVEVSRGLDALERVLTRAATEMDEAALHLALAGKYLKRWRAGETKGSARELPTEKTPASSERRGATVGDPLVGIDLPLSTWETLFRRLNLGPERVSGEIERRLRELV